MKDKQIALSDDHKIPSFEQSKRIRYCKFHNVFGNWTNSCLHFKDMVQKVIDEAKLEVLFVVALYPNPHNDTQLLLR